MAPLAMASKEPFPLLRLPSELIIQILSSALLSPAPIVLFPTASPLIRTGPSLLLVSHQISSLTRPLLPFFFAKNIFRFEFHGPLPSSNNPYTQDKPINNDADDHTYTPNKRRLYRERIEALPIRFPVHQIAHAQILRHAPLTDFVDSESLLLSLQRPIRKVEFLFEGLETLHTVVKEIAREGRASSRHAALQLGVDWSVNQLATCFWVLDGRYKGDGSGSGSMAQQDMAGSQAFGGLIDSCRAIMDVRLSRDLELCLPLEVGFEGLGNELLEEELKTATNMRARLDHAKRIGDEKEERTAEMEVWRGRRRIRQAWRTGAASDV
ncbi:MAG: hypothetical protein M1814_002116 [Vezdaea aestivalis]|nr:MAG: hypothetical protein M1814_002116 [Vezdaea aestivalis]